MANEKSSLKPHQIKMKPRDWDLGQLSEFENLIINHGYVKELDKETDKAILAKWELEIEGKKYGTNWLWIPKSLLEIKEENENE